MAPETTAPPDRAVRRRFRRCDQLSLVHTASDLYIAV